MKKGEWKLVVWVGILDQQPVCVVLVVYGVPQTVTSVHNDMC